MKQLSTHHRGFISIFVGLILCCSQFLPSATASTMTARLIDIPYNFSFGEFLYYSDYAFSVEFIGGEALKYNSCENLTSNMDLAVTYSVGKASRESWLRDPGYIKTLGATSSGLKCAFKVTGPSLTNAQGIYIFSQEEENVEITISISKDGILIGSGKGKLFNKGYKPSAPEFVGINRLDVIRGTTKFKFSKQLANGSRIFIPEISLCELANERACGLGIGTASIDGTASITANPEYAGQSAVLKARWNYVNNANEVLTLESSVLVVLGSAVRYFSLEDLRSDNNVEIIPNLDCDSTVTKGKVLNCTLSPIVADSRFPNSNINIAEVVIPFELVAQLNNGEWFNLKNISTSTGKEMSFAVTVPTGDWSRFTIRANVASLSVDFDSSSAVFGKLPSGPSFEMVLPQSILWNKPYVIGARATSGNLSACIFSVNGKFAKKTVGVKNFAKTSFTTTWSVQAGRSPYIPYTAECWISGKKISAYGVIQGVR